MNGGDDVFTASNGLASLISLTVDGGAGNDAITSGDGNDIINGGRGNDVSLLGGGNDTFVQTSPNEERVGRVQSHPCLQGMLLSL
jgi:Ca2+-binding RTX toxin-like protein